MDDLWVRLFLVVFLVGVSLGIAWIVGRRTTYHPPLQLGEIDLPEGIVMFTSTDCSGCREALSVAKATGAPLREITFELEPAIQEQAGVTGVPLTLVVDDGGEPVAQIAGVLKPARLRRELRRAGIG